MTFQSMSRGAEGVKIEYGSYVGTGTYGQNNPTSLTFGMHPIIVFVGCQNSIGYNGWPSIFMRDCPASHSDSNMESITVVWRDNGLSWYDTKYSHGQLQNNDAGVTYYYVAIGK